MLNMTLGLPLTVAALTATAIMLVIVYCTKMYIPPAGALTILSMIIPSESVTFVPVADTCRNCGNNAYFTAFVYETAKLK